MRRVRPYLVLIVLLVVVFGLAVLSPAQPQSAADHSSRSDAPDGTSALFAFAAALGHPVETLTADRVPASTSAVLFVFTPTTEYTSAQATALLDWVRHGGILVYGNELEDAALDGAIGLGRNEVGRPDGGYTAAPGVFYGTSHLAPTSGFAVSGLVPARDQASAAVAVYGGYTATVATVQTVGSGRVFALGDPCILCNGQLGHSDNGALAADLIGLAPAGAGIAVDEYHHGEAGGAAGPTDWVTTPWGAAIAWLLVLGYAGLMLRGRAFGPLIPAVPPAGRSSGEYAQAVGGLLRRTGGRQVTAGVVVDGARRALAERFGLGHGATPEVLERVLRQRAPEIDSELREASTRAETATSERDLLASARRLHDLAYPSPVRRERPG